MPVTREEFIALEGNIKAHVNSYFEKKDDYITPFYTVENDVVAQQTYTTAGAMGKMTEWGGTVAYDTFSYGYSKQIRYTKYSTGLQVPIELVEEKEYKKIKSLTASMNHGILKTLRYYSGLLFEQAFSTGIFTGPDSAALCSASHHNVPGDTAQSNTNTLELNYDNLETTQLAMQNFTDDKGDKMEVELDLVIAGPALRRTCEQLFGSDKEAYTADNQKNYYKGTKYYIHPHITGNKWFGANEDLMKEELRWWMRRDPRNIQRDGDIAKGDFDTEMLSWKAVGSWKQYWINWWFIYGNNPS